MREGGGGQTVGPVRDEPTEVLAQVGVCHECGAEMSVPELDEATLVAAFNAYRAKYGLMVPEELFADTGARYY